jgi:RNA polymerase sigma factor, sigma-70 family
MAPDKGRQCRGEACRQRIYHWLLGLVNSRDDAEDLCQEICLRCLSGRTHLRDEANFFAWLRRIAQNTLKDFLRKKSRQTAWLETELDEEALMAIQEMHFWRALAEAKERSAVWEALSRLPERQRRLLVMKYVEGYSHKAIAEHLGITEQSAWQLLHRAKKAFKEAYMDIVGGKPDKGSRSRDARGEVK